MMGGPETHADTPVIPLAAPQAAFHSVTPPSAGSHGSGNRDNSSGVPPACVGFTSRMWNNFSETVLPLLGGVAKAAVLSNRDPAQMTKSESRKIQDDILESSYSKYLFSVLWIRKLFIRVFWIRIDLNTNPDLALEVNTVNTVNPAPDSDPGFFMVKM